jgi:gamma-glutamylcyclotransferase (GGCT)/AIG2-like uncharacterized protein YtfP
MKARTLQDFAHCYMIRMAARLTFAGSRDLVRFRRCWRRRNSMLTLFVYGTLQRGQANEHYLRGQTFLGVARTLPRYRLYDAGAYPCLVEDEADGEAIWGELWRIDDRLLPALDALEEAPELFERREIALDGAGEPVVAYLYRGDVRQLKPCRERWPE